MGIPGVKTNNAVGNHNSGRKSAYEEFYKTRSINRLWEKVDSKIQAGIELSEYEEKLVLSILPKTVKTQTDITSGDKPLPLLAYVLNNDSNEKDNGNEGENPDSIGGDIGEQINIDTLVPDSSSTE